MLAVAMSTAKQKGWVNADKAAFVETILTAVALDMTSGLQKKLQCSVHTYPSDKTYQI
jgi:hypothetical protein